MGTLKHPAALVCAVVVAITACRDSGPEPGVYSLAFVNRQPVPETLEYQNRCVIVLMAGSITIIKPDTFKSVYKIQRNCADSTSSVPDPGVTGTFSTSADTVFFLDQTGHATGRGAMRGDTIMVQGPRHELRYVKAAE